MQQASEESRAVLERALTCLHSGIPEPLTGEMTLDWSERCVEIPWVSAHLNSATEVLDIGWSMSPPEWLGVLLEARREGISITGIDIVDPNRVRKRFLPEMLDDVLDVPVIVGDILAFDSPTADYDLITCVSTLEHIGFDVATPNDVTESVFSRAPSAEEAQSNRATDTDELFLATAHRLLSPGGRVLVTVPVGAGHPILHRDCLGFFTYQFEYGQAPWEAILSNDHFMVSEQAYFRWSESVGWSEVRSITELVGRTSDLKPHAIGCAGVELTRK